MLIFFRLWVALFEDSMTRLDNWRACRTVLEIRRASDGDMAPVLEFCRDTFSWGDYIGEVWHKWASSGGLYVLEKDGRQVGMYHVEFLKDGAWLEGMRVHPEFRGMGLGTMMMRHAESVAGRGILRLVVESENHRSIALVRSCGYELEEKWRLYCASPVAATSSAILALPSTPLGNDLSYSTYADSWRWRTLDTDELLRLVGQGRVLVTVNDGVATAMGIWNRSSDFPRTFQLGLVQGSMEGIGEIVRRAQDMAQSAVCDRLQIFAQEGTALGAGIAERKSLFYLMRKEI